MTTRSGTTRTGGTLGDRVTAQRKAKGWTQAELASRVTRAGFRISQGGIAQIERRGNTEPKSIVHLAHVLELQPSWLQTGKGVKESGARDSGSDGTGAATSSKATKVRMTAEPAPEGTPDVPVWASAEAGSDGAIILTPDPIDYIRRSERLRGVREPFAFYVVGHSMSPAIKHGDQVVVNPILPVRPGVECVFIHADASGTMFALVKELLRSTAENWRVRQHNPAKDYELPKKKWSRAHVIAEIRRGGL